MFQVQIREQLTLGDRMSIVRCECDGSLIEAALGARLPDIEFDLRCWAGVLALGRIHDVDG